MLNLMYPLKDSGCAVGEVPVKEVRQELDKGITALVLLKDALDMHRASGVLTDESVTSEAVSDIALSVNRVFRVL